MKIARSCILVCFLVPFAAVSLYALRGQSGTELSIDRDIEHIPSAPDAGSQTAKENQAFGDGLGVQGAFTLPSGGENSEDAEDTHEEDIRQMLAGITVLPENDSADIFLDPGMSLRFSSSPVFSTDPQPSSTLADGTFTPEFLDRLTAARLQTWIDELETSLEQTKQEAEDLAEAIEDLQADYDTTLEEYRRYDARVNNPPSGGWQSMHRTLSIVLGSKGWWLRARKDRYERLQERILRLNRQIEQLEARQTAIWE